MSKVFLFLSRKNLIYLTGSLGGVFAGIGLSQGGSWFTSLALALLWASSQKPLAGFLWGFAATLISHRWLLALHPLTWIGVSEVLSFPIAFLIWVSCGCLGALLVWLWCLLRKVPLLKRAWDRSLLTQFLSATTLSLGWGLSEVILAKGPLFWYGIGGGIFPNDLWLAGLSRWFGEGGLATIQLLIGWWIWKVFLAFKEKNLRFQIFSLGCLAFSLAHFFGWILLAQDDFFGSQRIALWQTNIPIRKKFSREKMDKFPIELQEALGKASRYGADLMVAPEGTLLAGQNLPSPAPVDFLTGGFRWVQDNQRSSLLVFEKGNVEYSASIDKHRLVPLGESIPSVPFLASRGLSLVGGLQPGDPFRLLNWSRSPVAVAICYEMSDGTALVKAAANGAQWILSIANLDPYPISLQKQFVSLAQLRSIESGRDLISVSNTGPTALISSSGEIHMIIPPFQEGVGVADVRLTNKNTGYGIWGELPLELLFLASLGTLLGLRKDI